MPLTLWRASLESRSFSFEAYGATEADAHAAMRRTIRAHAKQYDCDPQWVRDVLAPDAGNVNAYPITLGAGYRDTERITR